jgi:hypothetical protein
MAKGASKSVVEMLECREDVGEYRRAGGRHRRGVPSGTGDPGEATPSAPSTGLVESPVPGRLARRVREAARGNPPVEIPAGRPESTSHSFERATNVASAWVNSLWNSPARDLRITSRHRTAVRRRPGPRRPALDVHRYPLVFAGLLLGWLLRLGRTLVSSTGGRRRDSCLDGP